MMNLNQYKPTTLKAEIDIWFDHDPYDIETIEVDMEKDCKDCMSKTLLEMFQGIVTELATSESDEANLKITIFQG